MEIGGRQVVECARCGLLSTSPRVDEAAARRQYADVYYSSDEGARFKSSLAELVMLMFRRRRARKLARILGGVAGKRVLDVGCGRGQTLEALQRLGGDVHGTEMSPPAARAARQRLGSPDRIVVGELAEAGYASDSFDCVTMWHVLEHTLRPLDVLVETARVVKPGGLVYVEVPNAGGWPARRYGADWLAFDIDHHVSHFTERTLLGLAGRAALEPVRQVHISLEYSPVTLVQTWLNRIFGGRDRLFRAMAVVGGPSVETGRLPIAGHAACAALLFPAAVVVSVWAAARGAGDTIGVYFRKPHVNSSRPAIAN